MHQRRNHYCAQSHRTHGSSKRDDKAHKRITVRERKTPVDQLRELSDKDLNSAMAYQPRTQYAQAKYGGVLQNQVFAESQNQVFAELAYNNSARHNC